ncbi:DUF3352 domain-containing protein [Kovacikia minuta CCNUW1]|uniref:DUF3352 domain-containing protein n=1 Tax=Kovacikia minuta TaxID=2931930 RepID=UPI001CCA8280|nr:DUF3352 domain-containing protein [Kovacikia minuta]UBF26035.1 DUF3352 domain-containing protein [Kovacikia minuta CCNUW1]
MLRCFSVLMLATIALPGYAVAQTPAPKAPPQAATALPANTPGVLLLNTDAAAWQTLSRFNPFPTKSLLPFTLPLAAAGQDIQSWLGDQVAIALLPTTSSDDSFGSNIVMLAPIKNTSNFNTFLTKLKAIQGQPQIERDYKGVTILQWSLPSFAPEAPQPESPEDPDTESEQTFLPQFRQAFPGSAQRQFVPLPATGFTLQTKAIKPGGSLLKPGVENLPPFPAIPQPGGKGRTRVLAIALLPDNVAIASQSVTLERLIDARLEGGTSLAQNPLFLRTVNHPQFGRSLLVGYGEIASFTRLLANFYKSIPGLSPVSPILSESQINKFTQVYNTIDTHLWVQPEGIHGQTNLYYTKPQPQWVTSAEPNANQILSRLPAATYVSANSRNFKQQWQNMVEAGQYDPVSQDFVVSMRKTVPSLIGLDLEKDLLPWMDGEYTFFLFPTQGGLFNYISPDFNLGLGLMVQTSDRPAAEAALKKLDQFVQSQSRGEVSIVPRLIKGQPVVSWEGRQKDKILSIFSHGWVGRDTLVVTTGTGPMAALNPKPYLPLHLNYTFKTATESLPAPNDGYFYINMGSSLALLYGLILPSVPQTYAPFVQQVQQVLGTLRSVSTTTSATADAQRVDSLWVLKTVK